MDHMNGGKVEIKENMKTVNLDREKKEKLLDFNTVKDSLFPRLVGNENESNLKEKPYRKIADLYIEYYIYLGGSDKKTVTMPLNNELLKIYNVSEETLYKQAIKNLRERMPGKIINMDTFIARLFGKDLAEDFQQHGADLFIVTNESNLYGASVILNPEMLQSLFWILGDRFILLPSSIHEFIALRNLEEKEYLKAMVREINRTELSPDEILSDNIYMYENGKGLLVLD